MCLWSALRSLAFLEDRQPVHSESGYHSFSRLPILQLDPDLLCPLDAGSAYVELTGCALLSSRQLQSQLGTAQRASLYRALHAKQPLTTEFLLEEQAETVPLSVSRREDLDRLREVARERFVPVA